MTLAEPYCFSIVTATRNGMPYLPRCVESVARQRGSFTVQHIIQDCLSNDGSLALLERYPALDVASQQDAGLSDGLNRGFRRCNTRSNAVGWLNSDEGYLPGALEYVRKFFLHNQNVDVLYGDTVLLDSRGDVSRLLAQHKFSDRVLETYGCYIQTASTFYRGSLLAQLGLDVNLRQSMDWELYLRLRRSNVKFEYARRPLAFFTLHDGQLSNTNNLDRNLEEKSKIRSLYGISESRAGLWEHRARKLISGGYLRELLFRARFNGLDDLIDHFD